MNSKHPERKEKIKHQLREMLELFLYLAFFFCALAIYDMLLLKQYSVEYWTIAFAVINAAVITKVIMIGEYAKLGKRFECKALLVSAVWKALVFGWLVFAFQVVEEVIKRLIHGADLAKASRDLRFEQFASRAIIAFGVFISLFAWREFRRTMGGKSSEPWYMERARLRNEGPNDTPWQRLRTIRAVATPHERGVCQAILPFESEEYPTYNRKTKNSKGEYQCCLD